MGDSKRPPEEWQAAANKVLAGTDLTARVRRSDAWAFLGTEGEEATPSEYNEHFHVTVMVPGHEPIVGQGPTVETAAEAARSRVEAYLAEQKGE